MKKYLQLLLILIFSFSLLINGCGVSPQTTVPVQTDPVQTTAGTLQVHFIDVGQGDAILVQTPAGQNMLVDAGDNSYGGEVIEYLTSQGVEQLDIVVGTHPHADHIGGLDTVIDHFPVQKVYLPKVTHTTKTFRDLLAAVKDNGLKVTTAKAGVDLPLEGLNAYFAAPVEDSYESLNNYSAVIKIDYGSHSFLFTGDAEAESEAQILSAGTDIKTTVLKVGHHGSSSSTSPEFLQAAAPRYAVIMLGEDNPYGHPHRETMELLNSAGVEIFRTDRDGTIVFSTNGEDIEIN
ncbi:MAG: MBL fold metallo-hydrolase [Syntrophomonadaceae bacterium]|nr:MBL fold metallo-hydrolase [Syntrophomonadaceae bacterium]